MKSVNQIAQHTKRREGGGIDRAQWVKKVMKNTKSWLMRLIAVMDMFRDSWECDEEHQERQLTETNGLERERGIWMWIWCT
jgi:hypothetical protein